MWIVGITALALLLVGFPLWATLLISSVTGILFGMATSPEVIVQQVIAALDIYVLLAVPGFIMTGELLARSGMSDRLINWVHAVVGRIPGSMPLTTIGTSEVFGAISGSSPATVAAIGRVLYPALRERAYSERFSLGLITSSGAIAVLVPPSIAMILFAAIANVSLARLFLAGVVPGILVGVALGSYSIVYTLRHHIRDRTPFSLRHLAKTTVQAAWTLGAPLIIFVGIYGGFLTPTEAAGMAAAYVIVAGLFGERSMRWPQVTDCAREAGLLTSKIFLIVAAAGLFSWVLTVSGFPRDLATFVQNLAVPWWAVLVAINVILLLTGMFVDTNSAILVLTPLLTPIVTALGVDIIHFGVIMVLNLAVGMFTPPFGLNIFVSSGILRVSAARVSRAVLPFIAVNIVVLLLVTYVPALSLALPDAMME